MEQARQSIVLIGMPGAGKSTLGILLAKTLGLAFGDTDLSIQVQQSKTLQQISDDEGYLALRHYEEQVLLSETLTDRVIATGGSAIYGKSAMQHLTRLGHIIYLRCPLSVLDQRIGNMQDRGIAAPPGQGLHEVEAERVPLYEQYADATLDIGSQSMDDTLTELLALIKGRWPQQPTRA